MQTLRKAEKVFAVVGFVCCSSFYTISGGATENDAGVSYTETTQWIYVASDSETELYYDATSLTHKGRKYRFDAAYNDLKQSTNNVHSTIVDEEIDCEDKTERQRTIVAYNRKFGEGDELYYYGSQNRIIVSDKDGASMPAKLLRHFCSSNY